MMTIHVSETSHAEPCVPAAKEPEPAGIGPWATTSSAEQPCGRRWATRFSWYLHRARVMGPAEMLQRLHDGFTIATLAATHRLGVRPDPALVERFERYEFCRSASALIPQPIVRDGWLDAHRQDYLRGRIPTMPFPWTWTDRPACWHVAPDTGRRWPDVFFGHIAYRAGNPYGDVRVAWEPARLQHLVALARIAQRTADEQIKLQAVDLIERQLAAFVAANPPWAGIHYISSMECALRLVAACHTVDAIRPWIRNPSSTWPALLRLVQTHAELIARRISSYSSAGNHTVAEAVGLVYAGALFPELPRAVSWLERGRLLLEREAPRQILADGSGAEQACGYLAFVSDLLGLAAALLSHRGHAVPAVVVERHLLSRPFLRTLCAGRAEWPAIGDWDGGVALIPGLTWPADDSPARPREFTGYSVFSDREGGVTALWDHGPLGLAPCFGHGHADALSFTLSVDRQAVLIDPGTYSYGAGDAWRRYFRGTGAHNTVTVDGLDQASQEGTFLWAQPYSARLVRSIRESDGRVLAVAMHDGYASRCGVTHRRGLLYGASGTWLILDRLTGSGSHRLELNWHWGIPVEESGTIFRARIGHRRLWLRIHGGSMSIFRGSRDPLAGWQAPRYGELCEATTLRASYCGPLPHEFVTHISISHEPSPLRTSDVDLLRTYCHDTASH